MKDYCIPVHVGYYDNRLFVALLTSSHMLHVTQSCYRFDRDDLLVCNLLYDAFSLIKPYNIDGMVISE